MIASMLDLAHTGTTPLCRRKQEVADTLATRLQLDMARWWSPISDFFMGLTKAQISAAIMQSPAALALSTDADRAEFEALLTGKKKDELSMLAVQSLEGSDRSEQGPGDRAQGGRWLPGVITTAGLVAAGDGEPGFVVTDEGLEALAASEAVGPDVVAAMGVAAE